jgi:hypothetical protein
VTQDQPPHKRGGRDCPSLGLVGEPNGQHSQQRPTEGKAEQDRAGKDILFCREERGGDENQGSNASLTRVVRLLVRSVRRSAIISVGPRTSPIPYRRVVLRARDH